MQTGTGVNRTRIITLQALFTTNPQAIMLSKQRHSTLENMYVTTNLVLLFLLNNKVLGENAKNETDFSAH